MILATIQIQLTIILQRQISTILLVSFRMTLEPKLYLQSDKSKLISNWTPCFYLDFLGSGRSEDSNYESLQLYEEIEGYRELSNSEIE